MLLVIGSTWLLVATIAVLLCVATRRIDRDIAAGHTCEPEIAEAPALLQSTLT